MNNVSASGFHHVAYGCKDLAETVHFYEDLAGLPLVHTEVKHEFGGMFRHVFFDTGDGSAIAFFALENVGERPDWRADHSDSVGVPLWVNHVAFRATEQQQAAVRQRMADAGISPTMMLDHGWCTSHYYVDPNGILIEFCVDKDGGFHADSDEAHRRLLSDEDTDRTRVLR